jgi:hypothetical protein
MGSFLLNWTPAGGLNSTGQQVQYKVSTDSTWTTVTTLSASASTYTVLGLVDNTIYDFRVVNLCSFGGPTSGTNFQTINLTCPTVTVTPTYNSVSFSFPNLGASVTEYRVDLLNAAGSLVLAFKNITATGVTMSDSFVGLSSVTGYQLRVTVKAGTFSKVCTASSFTTDALPSCGVPSGLAVTVS